jgi:hypothetical protein
MAHLNGAGDQNLVVNASAFAACPTADPGFVHLDMLVCAATDAILVRADLESDNYDGRLPTIKLAKSGSRRVARRELPV